MKGIAFTAALSLVLVFVWERVDLVRIGYQIERLKAQRTLLERERDELRVKFSALTAPDRIARAATEKLGMAPADKGQVIVVQHEMERRYRPEPVEPSGEVKLAKNDGWRRVR